MIRLVSPTVYAMLIALVSIASSAEPTNYRTPKDDSDLKFWMQNMVWHHGFTAREVKAATGLSEGKIKDALKRFNIQKTTKPKRPNDAGLLVLPYPGGRHPRIGFLDGAVRPQRETKVSVFTPWAASDYVVVDVPEAIWSNLGLTYLAHTHVPTVWTKKNVELEKLEWQRHKNGSLELKRQLPNGIAFGTTVSPKKDHVLMKMWLRNGTDKMLTDLRVQNCVMLKAAAGFNQQTNENKVTREPYTACKSQDGKRWIITAWTPCHRAWNNARCPCLHSDPKFPDCAPGKTEHLTGWLSFYEGTEIEAEFDRIDATGWKD